MPENQMPTTRSGSNPYPMMEGNLVSIRPFFIVKDLQASISHYIERFGFKLDFQGPPPMTSTMGR